jgi:hypothetical protein
MMLTVLHVQEADLLQGRYVLYFEAGYPDERLDACTVEFER